MSDIQRGNRIASNSDGLSFAPKRLITEHYVIDTYGSVF